VGDFEDAVGAGAFGVDDAFGDAFGCYVGDDFEEVDVPEEVDALEFVPNAQSGLGVGDGEA
jgi:hypothetical protein